MKKILLLLLSLPALAMAQNATVAPAAAPKEKLLEGFVQAGYVHELWVVSDKLSYGYSSLSYTGNGFYAGLGLRSRMNQQHPLGLGLSVDYLQYKMDSSLTVNEGAPAAYGYLRLTPMVYYRFNSKSQLNFTARGDIGLMAAVSNNARSYIHFGLKGCFGYKAYEANLGFNFSQAAKTPAADLDSKWREQMFTLGLVCYPGRIPGFLPHRAPKSTVKK